MKIKPKTPLVVSPDGKFVSLPEGTIDYFKRLCKWRRKNGLREYNLIHADPSTQVITFSRMKKEKRP